MGKMKRGREREKREGGGGITGGRRAVIRGREKKAGMEKGSVKRTVVVINFHLQ